VTSPSAQTTARIAPAGYHARTSAAPDCQHRARGRLACGAAALAWLGAGCLDLRDFRGQWTGPRIGDDPALAVGLGEGVEARLDVEEASLRTLRARLSLSDGTVQETAIEPLAGAEADALAELSFAGSPARVYLAFAATTDGAGDALVIAALFNDPRIELRLLRGAPVPLYGIFALSQVE
jgi:hypothetical protein